MKKFGKRASRGLVKAGIITLSALPAFADGNVTMPTPDYTDFYAGVGVVLGVSVVVMLARRLKGFFR